MQYDEFVRSVTQNAGIPWEDAERLTAATLQTLASGSPVGRRPKTSRGSFPRS